MFRATIRVFLKQAVKRTVYYKLSNEMCATRWGIFLYKRRERSLPQWSGGSPNSTSPEPSRRLHLKRDPPSNLTPRVHRSHLQLSG